MAQRQDRDRGAARRHRRRSGGVVRRTVLCAVLPDPEPEGAGRHGANHDRHCAPDRHAVLHPVRRFVGPHRPQADHAGGLCTGGGDLLPDLPGHHPLRQSETGSGTLRRAGDGDGRSCGMLVPVQGDGHGEVHDRLRCHQIGAGRSFGELQQHHRAGRDQGERASRRVRRLPPTRPISPRPSRPR